MKLYKYTLLNTDGTTQELEPCKKKEFNGVGGLYQLLDCTTIELIPRAYYKNKKWGHCTVFGDEEARFKGEPVRNAHFDVLSDPLLNEWDVVGLCIKEEVYHE